MRLGGAATGGPEREVSTALAEYVLTMPASLTPRSCPKRRARVRAAFHAVATGMLSLAFGACSSGGGGGDAQPSPQPSVTCAAGSVSNGTTCRVFATVTTVRAPTPFTEEGRPVELAIVLYAPPVSGRLPTVLFNHGSTGDGSDPSLFDDVFTSETVARLFAEKGWPE